MCSRPLHKFAATNTIDKLQKNDDNASIAKSGGLLVRFIYFLFILSTIAIILLTASVWNNQSLVSLSDQSIVDIAAKWVGLITGIINLLALTVGLFKSIQRGKNE